MTEPLAETRKAAARAEREKRLAAALRENLRRRKRQAHTPGSAQSAAREQAPSARGPRQKDTAISEEETQKPQRSA